MNYQEALKRWGKQKLEEWGHKVDLDTVYIKMQFDEGYACCGGRDESCYCSMAESPSANVEISGRDRLHGLCSRNIDAREFDFIKVLSELVAIADGHMTA